MKTNILFVDDDPNILSGLQRSLRSQRDRWNIAYANSGDAALQLMKTQPVDIIISDMKMPGMNGAQLLNAVMARYPETIRLILSGHADPELVMQTIGVAHQFISKPCDPETIITIIERAIGLRQLLQDDRVKNTISEMNTIPSVPTLYLEMLDELHSPEPSVHKVGAIIAKDPGMTAKILQLANSAFFGLSRHLSNPIEAVSYLGINHIQNLFLAYHAFSLFTPPSHLRFSMDLFWEHSLSTAVLAKDIATREGAPGNTVNDAFTAGLLHDIGKLLFACKLPDRYVLAAQEAMQGRIPLWQAEKQLFSVTHAEIGAYLLGLWGLPDNIVESVAYHHAPGLCPQQQFSALTALHAADGRNSIRCLAGIPSSPVQMDYLKRLLGNTEDF